MWKHPALLLQSFPHNGPWGAVKSVTGLELIPQNPDNIRDFVFGLFNGTKS
ncbi:MAG: hypothetical protein GY758_31980 [Fuerstiella sp.]|nr:hypothetical protein [Fuerstiella sp.]